MEDRLNALQDRTQYGPSYNRNVAEPYHTARKMLAAGRTDEASYWTLMAEMRAGLMSFEAWQEATR
jgi:hypothetical protein